MTPVSTAKTAGIWALKILATVAVAMVSIGIVLAVNARWPLPFINPPSDVAEPES